jgi:putative addiction module component (TIGR02574 family)
MAQQALQLLETALNLEEPDRAFPAERLLSLDAGDDFPLSDAWRAEIARRLDRIGNGEAELIPAEEVFRKLREQIG